MRTMTPRMDEEGFVEEDEESVTDVILEVPTEKVEEVLEAIAEPVREVLEGPEK